MVAGMSSLVVRGWTLLIAATFVLAGLCWSASASAYPWMNRHGYFGCTTCHAAPSGGELLTRYGRAQSDLLLRMRYGRAGEGDREPTSRGKLDDVDDFDDFDDFDESAGAEPVPGGPDPQPEPVQPDSPPTAPLPRSLHVSWPLSGMANSPTTHRCQPRSGRRASSSGAADA